MQTKLPFWQARRLLLALWLVGCLLQIEQRLHYPNLYLDTEIQLASAHNWLKGEGFGYTFRTHEQAEVSQFRSGHIFMPGYALALAGMYQLTGNWWWAVLGIDALALIGLFWSSWWIWGIWSKGKASRAQFWLGLFLAWSPAPFHYLTGSGLLALSFLSVALWAWLKGIASQPEQRWKWWGSSLLISWSMVGLRTAYLPLIVVIPLGMALVISQSKQRKPWLPVAGSILFSLLLFGLIQWGRNGQESLTDLIDGTWYWRNLWELEPFLFKSFLYYGLPHELALKEFSSLAYWVLQFSAYSLTVIGGVLWGKQAVNFRLPFPFRAWGQLGLLVMGITLTMLGWLSIRIPPESWNEGGLWTFVMEPRYFAPIMWMWVLFAFGLMDQLPSSWVKQGLTAFLIAASLLACTYPVYLRWRMYGGGDLTDSWLSDPRKAIFFEEQNLALPDAPFLLTSPSNTHLGNLIGGEVLAWEDWEKAQLSQEEMPIPVLVLLAKQDPMIAEGFLGTLWQNDTHVLMQWKVTSR